MELVVTDKLDLTLSLYISPEAEIGHAVSLDVNQIGTSAVVMIIGDPVTTYIGQARSVPVIDGLFGEWTNTTADPVGDTGNRNVDLTDFDAVSYQESAYFYLKVDGTILSGVAIPTDRAIQPAPSIILNDDPPEPPGDIQPSTGTQLDTPLPVISGEDTIYIFLEIIPLVGYSDPAIPFNADLMIEIHGLNGEINSARLYQFTGNDPTDWEWEYVQKVDAASGKQELEAGVDLVPTNVHYHLVSWDEEEDHSEQQSSGDSITEFVRYVGQGDGGATAGYWRFNDGSGTSATDSSGQSPANTGTLTNMESGDWVAGEFGDALQFDGIDEYVVVDDDDSLDLSSALSIEAWINNEFTQAATVFTKEDSDGVDIGDGGQVSTPAIADLDNDGTMEIVIAEDGGLHVLTHDGSTFVDECTFTPDAAAQIKSSPQVANLDGDSLLEVVIGDKNGVVYVLDYTDGTPSTLVKVAQVSIGDDIDGAGIALADIDGDSTVEIIVTYLGGCQIYNYDGSTTLTQEGSTYSTGVNQVKCPPSIADVDGDGDLEIVFADKTHNVYVLGHSGTVLALEASATYTSGSGVDKAGVAIADVDGDGTLEMVIADKDYIYVFSDDGDATLAEEGSIITIGGADIKALPAIADLDGDSLLEIVYVDKGGNLRVLNHDGSVVSEKAIVTGLGEFSDGSNPSIADLDLDGTLEIVCADDTNVYVYRYNGGASPSLTQEENELHGGADQKSGIGIADVDGDGYLNVVIVEDGGVVNSWETTGQATDVNWPSLGQNADNTGYQEYPFIVASKKDAYGLFSGTSRILGAINGRYLSASLSTGWHHVAMTYDGTTQTLFVDGTVAATKSFTASINTNSNDLIIGENYKGKIDEVRILNYAKTAFNGGLVINEVVYDSDTSSYDYVELYNHGDTTIDAINWEFIDKEGNTYKVPSSAISYDRIGGTYDADNYKIASGNSVTIWLRDASTSPPDDSTTNWYTGNSDTDGFGGVTTASVFEDTESVSIYDRDPDDDGTDENSASYTNIIDFVSWSKSDHPPSSCDDSTDDPVKAGLWTEDEYVVTTATTVGITLKVEGDNDEGKDDWEIMKSLTLTDPSGGDEDWEAGEQHAITWTSSGVITNVKLEYSKDNFVDDINVIIASTSNDGSYTWTVPDDPSSTVRVRVNDTTDSSVTDTSDAEFTITPFSFTLTDPDGGEDWEAGEQHPITWTSTGSIANVKLEYSTDGFSSDINTIVASTADDGSYTWTLPDVSSSNVRVRISNASDATVNDISDAVFTISGFSLTLTDPDGGEEWEGGSEQEITWTSTGSISNVKLEYSKDNFVSDINVIESSTPNDGTYDWTLPFDASTTVRVRVSNATNSSVNDVSDADFTITGDSLTLTAPNGGQNWEVGDMESITWSSSGSITNVKLEYSTDGFSSDINTIVASTPNDGSYTWILPNDPSTNVRVRVSNVLYSGVNDVSNADFTITGYSFSITAPNGAEKWEVAIEETITWTSTGSITNVKLEYSKDNFVSDINTIISSTPNDGSYPWTIPNDESTTVRVRISNATDASVNDISDADFWIVTDSLTITDPDGGEDWEAGEQHAITWTSTGSIANVKLEYSTDSFSSDINTIVASTTNDGSYTWTVPDDASSTVRVRISNVLNSAINDVSNADFTITGFSITITDPDGGEDWEAGTQHAITWTSTGSISSIKLEYSTDGFSSAITTITSSTPDDGSFTWTVPNDPSSSVRVRVSNASDSTLNDISAADFTISSSPPSIPAYDNANWNDLGIQQNDPDWWDSDWSYRKKLIIDSTYVDSSLSNFPVLVKIDSSADLDFSKVSGSSGEDIRFTDSSGNPLYYEIERWNDGSNLAEIWVKIPTISSSADTDFYLYYGNSGASDGQSAPNVWDSDYEMVHHLQESPSGTGGTHYDSTSNDIDGTTVGDVTTDTAGKIDGADQFDGTDDEISISLTVTNTFTMEMWIYTETLGGTWGTLFSGDGDTEGIWYQETNDRISYYYSGTDHLSTTVVPHDSWQHISIVNNAGSATFYLNGAADGTTTSAPGFDAAFIGNDDLNEAFKGKIDEVRISSSPRSASWIKAAYNSESDTLISYGTEETSTTSVDIPNTGTTNLQYQYGSFYMYYQFFTEGTPDMDGYTYSVLMDDGGEGTYDYVISTYGSSTNVQIYTWDSVEKWDNGDVVTLGSAYSNFDLTNNVVQFAVPVLSSFNPAAIDEAYAATYLSQTDAFEEGQDWETTNKPTPIVADGDYTTDSALESLTLTAPDGGEDWDAGEQQTITWTSYGTSTSVKLEYSTDGFSSDINTIVASTSNDGSYTWTIPNDASSTVRVRVSDVSSSSINDVSDADFSINGFSITVTDPDGGEDWEAGEQQAISWTSTGSIANVKLEYSKDGFSSDINTIIASTSNDGSYIWTIPDDTSSTVRIRVSNASDASVNDISNAVFTITGFSLTVTDPDGGEEWGVWEQHAITWTSTGSIANVKLEYSKDGFSSDINTISASTPNDGSYTWMVPNDESSSVRVRVSNTSDPSVSDVSGEDFTISGFSLTVSDPDGGEDWEAGEQHAITWTSTGSIANVKLEYSKDGFSSDLNTIIASTSNDGSYTWTVPDDASSNVRVRVSNVSDATVNDVSDGIFTITGFSITVTDPDGGEDWEAGTQHTITWTSTGSIASVKLEYSKDGFSSDINTIAASTPDDGTFTWTIPNDESTTVRIRVSNASDASVSDISDANFEISIPASSIPAYNDAGWIDLGVQQNDLSGSWWNEDWSYRKKITIDHTKVEDVTTPSTTYANFPLYIHATGLSNIKADGADIRFTTSDGTQIPREIEYYSSGTLDAWVKLTLTKDSGDSTDDEIYMYYGNSGATEPASDSTYGSENVWDSNFKMVQHLDETSAGGGSYDDHLDSTSYDNDGEVSGATMDSTGKLDGADEFDGSDEIEVLDDDTLDVTTGGTLEAWIYIPTLTANQDARLIHKNNNWEFKLKYTHGTPGTWEYKGKLKSASGDGEAKNAAADFSFNTWTHVAFTYDGSNLKIFIDGELDTSTEWSNTATATTENLYIGSKGGGNYFKGKMDEVRLSDIGRSEEWMGTSYTSQSDSAFLTVGSEETPPEGSNVDIINAGNTKLQYQADFSYVYFQFFLEADADPSSNTYAVLLDTDATASTMEYCIATDGTDVTFFEWNTDWDDAGVSYDSAYFNEVSSDPYVVQFAVQWADIPEDVLTTWNAKAVARNGGSNAFGTGGSLETTNNPTPTISEGDYTLPAEIPEFSPIALPIFTITIMFLFRTKGSKSRKRRYRFRIDSCGPHTMNGREKK